jgi:RNA polymerase sigma factor (sigma-70 family)
METDLPTVEDIIKRLRAGNKAAERVVYTRFMPRVQCLLRRRLPDDGAVAETANDVLLAVIEAIRAGSVRDNGALPAFVCGVARNLANNYLRTHAYRRLEEPLESAQDYQAPHDSSEAERLEAAKDALERLDESDRTVLQLVLNEGLKPGDIALRLGVSAEVVRARKCRALRRLIEDLGNNADGEGR